MLIVNRHFGWWKCQSGFLLFVISLLIVNMLPKAAILYDVGTAYRFVNQKYWKPSNQCKYSAKKVEFFVFSNKFADVRQLFHCFRSLPARLWFNFLTAFLTCHCPPLVSNRPRQSICRCFSSWRASKMQCSYIAKSISCCSSPVEDEKEEINLFVWICSVVTRPVH